MTYQVVNYTNKEERVEFDTLEEAVKFATATNGELETNEEEKNRVCDKCGDGYTASEGCQNPNCNNDTE